MTKLIFGCGYLGKRVAELWREASLPVVAITRQSWHPPNRNLQTFNADVLHVDSLAEMQELALVKKWHYDTLLYSVGYDRSSASTIDEVYATGLQNVLSTLPPTIKRVIYISTTGVYGSAGGDWVDENTPPDPQRDGGRASLAAERVLAESSFADRGVVLRLAGIYGPGRIPFLDKLGAGEPIPAVSTGYLNLIHVDDAAAVVVAAAERSAIGKVYCVSDGHPVERGDYYREVARLIGAPPPTFVAPDPNSPRAARAEADRRVNNSRMLADLGVRLEYPDYRRGLAAILAGC